MPIYARKIRALAIKKFLSLQAVQQLLCLHAVHARVSIVKEEFAKLVQGITQQFHLIAICQNFITMTEYFLLH